MHGNVAEWVIDQYHADAYKQLSSASPVPALQLCSELKRIRMCIEAEAASIRQTIFDRPDVLHRRFLSWTTIQTARKSSLAHHRPARFIGFRLARSSRPESAETIAKFWNPDPEIALDVKDRIDQGRNVIGILNPRK